MLISAEDLWRSQSRALAQAGKCDFVMLLMLCNVRSRLGSYGHSMISDEVRCFRKVYCNSAGVRVIIVCEMRLLWMHRSPFR